MTDPNKTSIVVVLDRSGSTQGIDADTCGGYNAFVEEQKKLPGECRLTLVRFDDQYQLDYLDKPIAEIPKLLSVEPRGWTALYDAIGKTIDDVGSRLSGLGENERPGKVIFVIITDGQENRSRYFTADRIKAMSEHQRHAYNWQFMFLGANQDAIMNAKSMGFSSATSADYSGTRSRTAFAYASQNIGSLRGMRGSDVQLCAFSAEQRKDLVDDLHSLAAPPANPQTVGELVAWFKKQGDLKAAGDIQALITAGKLDANADATGRVFESVGMGIGNANAAAKVQLNP